MTDQNPPVFDTGDLDPGDTSNDPGRDADGVAPDRLTGVAFYDTALLCYVGPVYDNKTAARKDDLAKDNRYVLRRV